MFHKLFLWSFSFIQIFPTFHFPSLVEKAFEPTSSKLLVEKPEEQATNDVPEELDGYRLERSVPGDQELPTITYSVIEISQPAQNQEK